MKQGLWAYIKAAFNARPLGMPVPPNWIGIAAVGLLGVLNPGVWFIGAGLELAYLFMLSTNKRFQKVVDGSEIAEQSQESREKLLRMFNQLSPPDQQRYRLLEKRCQSILEHQHPGTDALRDLQSQGEGLGRLLWIYLRLLVSRQAFARLLREVIGAERAGESLDRRAARVEAQLREPDLSDELRKSLQGQLEILRQRMLTQQEAQEKLAFLDVELSRIEDQVELIREQAILSTDPAVVSSRIDRIAAELSGTNQWIRDQQQVYGQVEDVLDEPPPVVVRVAE